MKAAVLVKDKHIEIREIDKPSLKGGEVLIRVNYTGVCGSDLHAYKGLHPFRKPPVVLGHEVSGTVVEIASDVMDLKIGDRVTVMPVAVCGVCPMCRKGKTNICLNKEVPGMGGWVGTFAEFFSAPARITYRLPDAMSLESGALCEPLATAVHSVKVAGVQKGHKVLILGGGTIGILSAAVARHYGAETVAITDVFDFNLKIAEELCSAEPYNVMKIDVQGELLKKHPEKFDSVILCASTEDTLRQSVALVQRGGRVVVTGMYLKPISFSFIDITLGEIAMMGSQIYVDEDFREALRLIEENVYPFEKIVTHKMPIGKANEALQMLSNHSEDVVKILLKV